jgi:hypothetical protein
VVKPVRAPWVGKTATEISGFDPYWLLQAARKARQAGATVLLAETTDRFFRNPLFNSVLSPYWQASDEQLKELSRAQAACG